MSLWDSLYKKGQLACFYHKANTVNAINTKIHSVFDIEFDDTKGVMKVTSIINDSSKTTKTAYASSSNTTVGNLAAQATRSGNAYYVYKALRSAIDDETVVKESAINHDQYDWENGVENLAPSETVSEYNNYEKLNKKTTTKDAAEQGKEVTINNTDYTIIGPFKMSFGGKDIKSVEAGDAKWTSKSSTDIYWATSASTTASSWSNDFNAQSSGKYKLNNKTFYLAVKTSKLPDSGTYSINIKQDEFQYYKARIVVCTGNNAQQIGMYCYDNTPLKVNGEVTWNIRRNAQKSLKIIKRNAKTDKLIIDVKFKVYAELTDGTKGWVSGDVDGDKTYVSSASSATEYEPRVSIEKLKTGTYYIYETQIGSGYDMSEQEGYKKAAKGSNTLTGDWVYLGNTKIEKSSSKTVNFTATNKALGRIKTVKIDEQTKEVLTSGKYKIYAVLNNGTKGWVSGGTTSSKTYVDSGANATAYTFGKTVTKLKYGTYYIYETTAPAGYNLGGQDGYHKEAEGSTSITGDWVYLGSKTVNLDTSDIDQEDTYTFTAKNKKTGNMKIVKIDAGSGEKLAGTGFKIYAELTEGIKGWLKSTDGKITYVSDINDATEFITDNNGEIELKDIEFGNYTIYETKSSSETNYAMEWQSGYRADAISEQNNWVYFDTVTVSSTDANVTFTAENDETIGDANIRKIDSVTGELIESDIGIKLYASTEGGWVIKNSDDTYSYDGGTYQEATEFVAESGTLLITNIKYGTYDIYETYNKSPYYDLEGQEGYDEETGMVYLGSVTVDSNNKEANIDVKNDITRINPRKINIPVEKVWIDSDNIDGIRPESITVNLMNGEKVVATATLSESNNWKYTFMGLPEKENGKTINYTVEEIETIAGYETTITGSMTEGYVITNTHTPDTIDIPVEKVWVDSDNIDGIRPESITVNLMNGETVVATATLDESNNWKYTFTGLPRTENGKTINYTVEESNVPNGYIETITGTMSIGFVITNTINTPDETIVPVTKVWDDSDNQYGLRPESITVSLMNGSTVVDTAILSESNNWQHTFTGLPKTENGTTINYTIEEIETITGYETTITGNMTEGYIITNKYIPPDDSNSNATIIKVDSENASRTLQGIEFKIYVENDITGKSYWLIANGENGIYDYTGIEYKDILSNYTASSYDADNTTFVTNSKGEITITCSPIGKYYFYEASTYGIEYAIDQQKGYDSTTGLALIDAVQLTTENSVLVNYELPNIAREKGNLTISKKGTYGNNGETIIEALPNMSFKLYSSAEGDHKEGNWVILGENRDGEQIIDFTSNFEDATVFTTDANGELTIEGLYIDFNPYIIVEVLNDELEQDPYYTDPIVIEGGSQVQIEDETYYAVTVNITADTTLQYEIIDNRSSGDLTIEKSDYTYNDLKLEGAEFKLQLVEAQYAKNCNGVWLVQNSDGTFDYTNTSSSSATTFVTDKDGKITLSCLRNGTYAVYETKAPIGYDITKQDGYDAENGWVHVGDATVSTEDNIVTYEITNKKIADKLEGYVWVDKPDTKGNDTDNIYGSESNDFLKEGITVNLYDGTGTLIATTTTDSEGHYEFTTKNAPSYTGEDKNIYYWDLAEGYVEFIYNNKTIYNEDGTVREYGYITVDPFVGTDVSVNSKAQEYTITTDKLDDNNLTGTTGNNPGKAVTYKATRTLSIDELLESTENTSEKIKNNTAAYDDLKETPLTGYYDNETYTVSNINLGLLEQNDPEFTVDETLAYIKVKMKGYTYTYKYGDAAATNSTNVPTVNEQNSAKTFTGKIYPTDIAYNMAESTEELQVYVVYSIDVKNNETTYIDNQYVEEKLYLDSLVNEYDTNRYVLCTDENNEDKNDFALWSNSTASGVASLNINNSIYKDGIAKQETKTSYIQFKMKESALEKILTGGLTYEDIESAPTKATARGYHEYLRTDNVWVDNPQVTAFNGCKGANSYPKSNNSGKKYYAHKSISKNRSSASLYLKLSLGEQRTISGTVFEDTSVSDDTKLGNGILDNNENNRAKEVTVELLNADKETVTKLYQVNDKKVVYNPDGTLPEARTKTVEGGTFTFEGVVPGYYYIRFTYGDGTQKMMPAGSEIRSNDYKSTIINTADDGAGDIIKNALEAKPDQLSNAQQTLLNDYSNEDAKKLVEWYKYLQQNYSTAVDDTNQRLATEKYVYKEDEKVYDESGNVVTYPTNVNAYTPMTGISIENDVNDYTDNGDYHSPRYDGFNFGIIEESAPKIKLDKKITNVSLTTQTGSTLVSANPTDRTASYVTALDNTTGGSKYAKVEIEPSLIYGSELKTTYEITITNNSVKDYIEDKESSEFGYYYKYGEKTDTAELKKITVNEVIDELDAKYNYDPTAGEVKETVVHEDTSIEESTVKIEKPEVTTSTSSTETTTVTNPDESITTTTNNTLSIKGWSGIESGAKTSINYTVTSLLSNEDNDTLYTNKAKITSISLDKLTTLKSNFEWGENLKDTTTLTITPTTGEDRSNTYWVAGAVALVVIAAGFVVLKKKVLK